MTATDVNWEPPACWWEPAYDPKGMGKWVDENPAHEMSAQTDWYREIAKNDYNKGKDGAWWDLRYNKNLSREEALEQCDEAGNPMWVDAGEEPEGVGPHIEPWMLAQVAYNATKLPAPPVELKPKAGLQKVNLPVHATFEDDAALPRVTTTAEINYLGVQFAATTVATPDKLRIEAGTANANPRACTYQLKPAGDGYAIDTADAGCNVKYTKESGEDTYPLKAQLTWKVYWTASADPDGAPQNPELPDGASEEEYDVTVKEVQAVVTDD
ncbi:hypothetical protein [Streptomyces boninensis]|uniref:hypothetical protein n=1 Tax=Streptomyces boninensis TaxID=2039455 RepID=UPI003B215A7C